MNNVLFLALRNRGCDQWAEIEAYRLALEDRIKSYRNWNTYLGIATLIFGVLVGGSGTDFLNLISAEITTVTTPVLGVLTAILAGMAQYFRFGEKIEQATGSAKELKAQRDQIVGQIYRLQRMDDASVEDQQLFFERRADDLRDLTGRLDVDYGRYRSKAEEERERSAFSSLQYAGQAAFADEAEAAEPSEAEADDIQPFGRGG